MPAPGARSSFSIFIASTTTSPAPASTRCPGSTSTRTTSPGIGARIVPGGAAATRPPVSAWIWRGRSSTTSTSTRSPPTPSAHPPTPPSSRLGAPASRERLDRAGPLVHPLSLHTLPHDAQRPPPHAPFERLGRHGPRLAAQQQVIQGSARYGDEVRLERLPGHSPVSPAVGRPVV